MRGLWAFVWAVALFDCAFAWAHRATFAEWELNPAARALGVEGAVAVRLGTVALGWLVLRRRPAATLLVFCAHAALALYYLQLTS